jgi:hypothetical protein
VRVLKGFVVSLNSRMPLIEKPLVLSAAQGGERQRSSLSLHTGYSAEAHCIGTPSYLPPNSRSLQKPIDGVYPYWRFSQPKTATAKPKFNLFKREGVYSPSTTVHQPETAKPERRLISWDLCLFSPVNQQCDIVLNVVETCSTR